jgi:hypothetical protein
MKIRTQIVHRDFALRNSQINGRDGNKSRKKKRILTLKMYTQLCFK